jgi:serine/threonine-protein phosphatase 2A regulatory subunit A
VDDTVEHLVPILLQFLRDETADVRLNVISNLDKISYVVGVDLLGASLLPAVQVLAQDSKWRVRMSLIEHMPMLAKRLGSEYFNSRMREICMGWLCDSVSTVRIEAAANIRKLAEIFGDAWIREELLPQLEEIRGMNNFIARLSFLTVVKELVNVASREVVESHLLPMLIAMSADAVPNIRLTAVRIMQEAVLRMNHLNGVPQSPTEAVSTLERLVVDDDDCDVRYFSKQALRGIHTAIMSTN